MKSFVQSQLPTNSYVGWNKNMSWPNYSFLSKNLLTDQVQKKSQILPYAYYPIFTTYSALATT